MANPLSKLIHPWYPSNAIGFEKGLLTMVQLERGKGMSTLKRAATVSLPESLIRPSFDEPNISDLSVLAAALTELAASAGLLQRKRWSASLPDASSRSLIMTLESNPARHVAEGQWLTLNGSRDDALLLSSSDTGFTVVVFRGKQPLIIRTVICEPDECEDELYRLLLFYRDKRAGDGEQTASLLSRLLVVGDAMSKERISSILRDTLGVDLRPLEAEDLGLQLSTRQLSFDSIAAPAGLATLSWQ